ncbi:MAG TPA: carboxypeptidase-like regulatory domain-containing protein [Gemmataceae bacterium]
MFRPIRCAALLAVLGLLAGCGGGGELAPVSGTVTLDGQPLPGATVTFAPAAPGENPEAGVSSYGKTDEQGRYSLKTVSDDRIGAVVGKHRVRISLTVGDEEDDSGAKLVDKVPPWYNGFTLLEKEVRPGEDNTIDFELTGQLSPEMRQQLLQKYEGKFGEAAERWLALKRSGKLK